jgi:hypothetical protein
MAHDPFRPHWKHKLCGGVVTGFDDDYKCLKCNTAGNAVGAVIPAEVTNSLEYFACHPELEVEFVERDTHAQAVGTPERGCFERSSRPIWKLARWREILRFTRTAMRNRR